MKQLVSRIAHKCDKKETEPSLLKLTRTDPDSLLHTVQMMDHTLLLAKKVQKFNSELNRTETIVKSDQFIRHHFVSFGNDVYFAIKEATSTEPNALGDTNPCTKWHVKTHGLV